MSASRILLTNASPPMTTVYVSEGAIAEVLGPQHAQMCRRQLQQTEVRLLKQDSAQGLDILVLRQQPNWLSTNQGHKQTCHCGVEAERGLLTIPPYRAAALYVDCGITEIID